MTNNDVLVSDLKRLLDENLERILVPHVNGNSIRIKHHIIRNSKAGWLVYSIKENHQIAKMFSKTAAVALAKSLAEGNNEIKIISRYDVIIQKNYLDAMFFKYNMGTTNDDVRKEILEIRYNIAKEETENAKDKLDEFIFD